jgi:hypothetical protein
MKHKAIGYLFLCDSNGLDALECLSRSFKNASRPSSGAEFTRDMFRTTDHLQVEHACPPTTSPRMLYDVIKFSRWSSVMYVVACRDSRPHSVGSTKFTVECAPGLTSFEIGGIPGRKVGKLENRSNQTVGRVLIVSSMMTNGVLFNVCCGQILSDLLATAKCINICKAN